MKIATVQPLINFSFIAIIYKNGSERVNIIAIPTFIKTLTLTIDFSAKQPRCIFSPNLTDYSQLPLVRLVKELITEPSPHSPKS